MAGGAWSSPWRSGFRCSRGDARIPSAQLRRSSSQLTWDPQPDGSHVQEAQVQVAGGLWESTEVYDNGTVDLSGRNGGLPKDTPLGFRVRASLGVNTSDWSKEA